MDNQIVKFDNNNNEIIEKGENVYETNPFMKDLYDMMTNDRFRNFVETYMNDSTSVKSVIMFIKLFQSIEEEYEKRCEKQITKEMMLFTITEVFKDPNLRKTILKSYENFENGGSKNKVIDL